MEWISVLHDEYVIPGAGIGAWEPNSRVVHATARAFEGPYTKQVRHNES